jgi:cytoskeletal protein CcmA (bactofilin family)
MADAPDDLGIPMKPVRPAGQTATVAPVTRVPTPVPPRAPELARAAIEPARPPEPVRRTPEQIGIPAGPPIGTPRRAEQSEARRLIVGRDISLAGEITSCDKLIVEGSVEANLQGCHEVEIAESGLFKGSASIDEAQVSGRFEGELVVRRRLLIRSTGRVAGTIRYGQLEVEAGGQLAGDIQAMQGDDVVTDLEGARARY